MTFCPSAAMTPDPNNWFAVQLRPNMRLIAERNLTRQGFTSFAPARLETFRRRGRLKTEARPLFPGYLFVQFDPQTARWQAINATRGVSRLITDGRLNPTPMPADFMSGLLDRCDPNGLLQTPDHLNPGDHVRILSGPFAGLVSRIEHLDQQERLHLLLQIMGRQVQTILPTKSVGRIVRPEPV
ncbi:transcription termination/antitermination NusG family protein [Ruegeria sp.]|uniref:transcription termination/antitermination protein NusG n=1 Tax=Ruegeria sp. TaxID=1879320 RepID=UPI0023200637|nr:transcription termination/antitermination NusG family protein [Ruegeria sp.]MDA7963538.1 KOW motif-containing protein [Ruegeria sp.]